MRTFLICLLAATCVLAADQKTGDSAKKVNKRGFLHGDAGHSFDGLNSGLQYSAYGSLGHGLSYNTLGYNSGFAAPSTSYSFGSSGINSGAAGLYPASNLGYNAATYGLGGLNTYRSGFGLGQSVGQTEKRVTGITVHEENRVAIPVQQPVRVEVPRPVAIPHPVPVKVDRLYPVAVPQPYPVPITRHVPVKVDRPYPVPVPQPVAVRVSQPVAVPVAHPVPVPVTLTKYVPVNVAPTFYESASSHGLETSHGIGSNLGLGAYATRDHNLQYNVGSGFNTVGAYSYNALPSYQGNLAYNSVGAHTDAYNTANLHNIFSGANQGISAYNTGYSYSSPQKKWQL